MRLVLRVTERVRAVMPDELPLFVRISATDWTAGGWDVEQSVELSRRLKAAGVDLIDVSTGGNLPTARIPVAKRYQVPCSRRIRDGADIPAGAVGLITDPKRVGHAGRLFAHRCGPCGRFFDQRRILLRHLVPYKEERAPCACGWGARATFRYLRLRKA